MIPFDRMLLYWMVIVVFSFVALKRRGRTRSPLDHATPQYQVYFAIAALALGLAAAFELSSINSEESVAAKIELDAQTNPQAIRANLPSPAAVASWAATALAQPLFSPDRAPLQLGAQTAGLSPALPRLVGVIITSDERLGIFGGPDGRAVVVKQGSTLGQFKVLSIAADAVQLHGFFGVRTLHVSYDNGPPARQIFTPRSGDEDNAEFSGSNSWPDHLTFAQQ